MKLVPGQTTEVVVPMVTGEVAATAVAEVEGLVEEEDGDTRLPFHHVLNTGLDRFSLRTGLL